MATTARSIIQEALETLGVYGPGEVANAADFERGLSVLNQMLDEWSNSSLACWATLEQVITLTPGKWAYTVGPGGDLDGTRPLRIERVPGAAYILDQSGTQYPVTVVDQADWNLRGSRNTNSNFPDMLFYDPQDPLGIINLDPIPNAGYQLHFMCFLPLGNFQSLDLPISFPPGYTKAIRLNLCLDLKPFFTSAQIAQDVYMQAANALASVKRTNTKIRQARLDPEILAKAPGMFSIYTYSYTRT